MADRSGSSKILVLSKSYRKEIQNFRTKNKAIEKSTAEVSIMKKTLAERRVNRSEEVKEPSGGSR